MFTDVHIIAQLLKSLMMIYNLAQGHIGHGLVGQSLTRKNACTYAWNTELHGLKQFRDGGMLELYLLSTALQTLHQM